MGWRVIMVLVWWWATTQTEAVYLDLPASAGSKCISEDIHSNVLVLGNYLLIDLHEDAHLQPPSTLSIKVTSPYGNILYQKDKMTYGEFAFTSTESGNYMACFWVQGNRNLNVSLEWRIGIAATDWESVARKEKIQGVELELRKLEDVVKEIQKRYIFLKTKEAEVRVESEKTNAEVAWFSIMSLSVCIGASILQAWFLKRFFHKKKLI